MKNPFRWYWEVQRDYWKGEVKYAKKKTWSRMFWVTYPFPLAALFLWHFGHYFEARLGITLAIVEIPIFMFGAFLASKVLREAREDAKEKKNVEDEENHKQYILAKLYRNAQNGHVEYRNGEIFDSKFKWIEMLEDHADAVSHLKSYGNILKLLHQARTYSDEITDKFEKKIHQYQEYVDKKLESFSDIPMSNTFLGSEVHCNKSTVKQRLYDALINKNPSEINLIKRPEDTSLMWGDQTFAVGNEPILTKLQNYIKLLKNDKGLQSITNEIIELNQRLDKNKALEQFETERKEIVRQLDKGHRELQGECSLCS